MTASPGESPNRGRRLAARAASRLPWLVDAYRLARHPGWERAVRADLVTTRDQARVLRSLPVDPRQGVALLALYRDDVYEAKLGLTLLGALRLRGVEPRVLVPSGRAHRARRYAHAYGVTRSSATDRIALPGPDRRAGEAVRDELMAGDLTADTVKAWRFHDCSLGIHALSTLIRVTFDGSPDLDDPANRARLSRIVESIVEGTLRYERLLDEQRPRVVLVEEANYATNGPLVDLAVARGIDVVQTVGTWRDDALVSKRLTAATRRVEPKSVALESLLRLERSPWSEREEAELTDDFAFRYGGGAVLARQFQPGTTTFDAAGVDARLHLDPRRPVAVLFAHVLWDASLFYGTDLFEDYAQWLVATTRAACANDRVQWIVKAHPSNVFRVAHGDVAGEPGEVVLLRRAIGELPAHVQVLPADTPISTLSLYRRADVGITVRGTPGMEMACHGKAILTAGTGAYSGLGFTTDSATRAEYLDRLARIHTLPPPAPAQVERARRYLHALFVRRPWTMRSFALRFDFPERGWHPLDRNVVVTARTPAEVHANGDLEPWADWVLDSDAVDYFAPAAP